MEHDEKFSFVVKFENEGLLSQGVLEVVLFRAAPFSQVATAHMLFWALEVRLVWIEMGWKCNIDTRFPGVSTKKLKQTKKKSQSETSLNNWLNFETNFYMLKC